MKAKIKATGEVINVERYGDAYAEVLPSCSERSYPEVYEFDELEFITEPDWQQVRIQASIEIAGRATFTFDKLGNIPDDDFAVCAKRAVQMADALITELKKGGDNGKSN